MKRRVSHGLSHPEILTAVAWCNLTTRSVFHRLYEKEERRLDDMTGRIRSDEAARLPRPLAPRDPDRRRLVQLDDAIGLSSPVRERGAPSRRHDGANPI